MSSQAQLTPVSRPAASLSAPPELCSVASSSAQPVSGQFLCPSSMPSSGSEFIAAHGDTHRSVVPPELQARLAPSLAGASEEISPSPSTSGSALIPLDVSDLDTRRDPFEDSDLQGFSLASAGSALSVRPSLDVPSSREELLWSMVRTGRDGKNKPRRIPHDKTERLYRQDGGVLRRPRGRRPFRWVHAP